MKLTLLTILEITHVAKNGSILWRSKNLPNVFHTQGEDYILRAVFTGGQANAYIPENYYFGLDNRPTLSVADTMTTIANDGSEPTTFGYFRQAVASEDQFQITVADSGHTQATSPIITFTATGGTWGPVSNLFLTDKNDNTGYLISSVALDQANIYVADGEGIHMRMGLTLGYCPSMPPI